MVAPPGEPLLNMTSSVVAVQDFLLVYGHLLTQFNEAVTSLHHLLVILRYVINELRFTTNMVDDEMEGSLAEVSQRSEELVQQSTDRRQQQQTTDVKRFLIIFISS